MTDKRLGNIQFSFTHHWHLSQYLTTASAYSEQHSTNMWKQFCVYMCMFSKRDGIKIRDKLSKASYTPLTSSPQFQCKKNIKECNTFLFPSNSLHLYSYIKNVLYHNYILVFYYEFGHEINVHLEWNTYIAWTK